MIQKAKVINEKTNKLHFIKIWKKKNDSNGMIMNLKDSLSEWEKIF